MSNIFCTVLRRLESIYKTMNFIEGLRVCQVFCVSFKKKFYGEGSLPFCDILFFNELPC